MKTTIYILLNIISLMVTDLALAEAEQTNKWAQVDKGNIGYRNTKEKETPLAAETDAELVSKYAAIWKTEFQKLNGFSNEEFAKQITITNQEIWQARDWKMFRVKYNLKIEWLDIPRDDKFTIFLPSKAALHGGDRQLPCDAYFSEAEVNLVITKDLHFPSMTKLKKGIKLAYSSLEEVKKEVKKQTGIGSYSEARVDFYVPGSMPRTDGHPYFIFQSKKFMKNEMIVGNLNLVTKKLQFWSTPAIIYN